MTEIHAFDPDGTPSPGALAALAAVTDGLVSEEQLAAATEGLPLEIVWDGSVLFVNGQASPDLKGTSGIASITSPRSGVWMIDQATDQDTETLSTLQQEVADKATRGELEALQGVIDSKLGPADKQLFLATPIQRDAHGYTVDTTNGNGLTLGDYREAILALGELYSVPVVDMYATAGITARTLPTFTEDGLHPNADGFARMADVVCGQLRSHG